MSLCNACNVRLADEESLKLHYKSEWHNLNAKRRTLELPPVTEDAFTRYTDKVAKDQAAAEAASAACLYICDACNKQFASEGQFETHIHTKKHATRVKELLAERKAAASSKPVSETVLDSIARGVGSDVGSGVSESKSENPAAPATGAEEEKVLVVTAHNCLFCFHESENLIQNFYHMKEKHSFFIPDFDHLGDPEGMAEYLLSKVIDGRCLYCRTESCFDSPQAAQQHMTAKAHCRIRYEDDDDAAEYEEFYDFSDEPEPVEGVSVEEHEGCTIVATPGGDAVITDGDDLLLPSGKRLISRKWMRYYSQYYRMPDERVTKQLERLALDYQQAGVMDPTSTALAARKAALSSGTRGKLADVRAQRRDERYQKHFALQTGMQHNMIIRKYFRIQLLQ